MFGIRKWNWIKSFKWSCRYISSIFFENWYLNYFSYLFDKFSGNHITVLCLASSSFLIAVFVVKKIILKRISQSNLLKEAIVGIFWFLSSFVLLKRSSAKEGDYYLFSSTRWATTWTSSASSSLLASPLAFPLRFNIFHALHRLPFH